MGQHFFQRFFNLMVSSYRLLFIFSTYNMFTCFYCIIYLCIYFFANFCLFFIGITQHLNSFEIGVLKSAEKKKNKPCCIEDHIHFFLLLSSKQWMGHPVEDLQEGAVRWQHPRLPLVWRGRCLPKMSGSQLWGTFTFPQFRHHRLLRSKQWIWGSSGELHDRNRPLPWVFHPGDQSRHVRPPEEQVQHWGRWQGLI